MVIILSNIVGGKLTVLFGFEFPAVLYFFPITFIIGDILTEVYGYVLSKYVIWSGFIANFLTIAIVAFVGSLPASTHWGLQDSYNQLFFQSVRISVASCIAYFGSEFLNAAVLSILKKKTNGRLMLARIVGASFLSDCLDSIIFCSIGFIGALPLSLVIKMMFAQFIVKLVYEVGFSPITCKICKYLKEKEHVDKYDYGVVYNPFNFRR